MNVSHCYYMRPAAGDCRYFICSYAESPLWPTATWVPPALLPSNSARRARPLFTPHELWNSLCAKINSLTPWFQPPISAFGPRKKPWHTSYNQNPPDDMFQVIRWIFAGRRVVGTGCNKIKRRLAFVICILLPTTTNSVVIQMLWNQHCCSSKKNSTTVSTQLVGTKAPPLTGQIANHTYDNGSTPVVASQKSEGSFEAV